MEMRLYAALHLNEVKNTPNTFVSKLKEGISKRNKNPNYQGQFDRYRNWIEKGAKQGSVRQAMVFIRNSEPKFHEIIDKSVLEELSRTIAKNNRDVAIVQIKNTKLTYNELHEFYQNADKKLRQLVAREKELNPDAKLRDLIGLVLDRNLNSMEKAFETMEKTYGY